MHQERNNSSDTLLLRSFSFPDLCSSFSFSIFDFVAIFFHVKPRPMTFLLWHIYQIRRFSTIITIVRATIRLHVTRKFLLKLARFLLNEGIADDRSNSYELSSIYERIIETRIIFYFVRYANCGKTIIAESRTIGISN